MSDQRLALLDVNERNELESLLMDFDLGWTPGRLGECFERLMATSQGPYRDVSLVELVKIDLHRSWMSGETPSLEDYLQRFPQLGNAANVSAKLILAEYEARRSSGSKIDLASYESRFPKQFKRLRGLASELAESRGAAGPSGGSRDRSAQASVDTSRVEQVRDTSVGKAARMTAVELPSEFGRYRILRELGAGAMGRVYLAHDSQLDRQVALKTPTFSADRDDSLVTRFYREARSAAKLHHRNICPVYDVGEIDGRHFISMAFVKGRSMAALIKPDKLPPQKTSAILIHRLAMALAEAHRHNVIHRDLKPANIMIDTKKEPVVMDFGLARQTDVESRVTQSGMAVGTPAYMSPEQVRGEIDEVGASADIYALGVILYELLTGQLPFRGPIAKVVYGIVHEDPVAASEIRSEIDPSLEAICAKMMAKNVGDRYRSMDEAARDLKEFVKGNAKPVNSGAPTAVRCDPSSSAIQSGQVTETGALNAYFATQVAQDPANTIVETLPKHTPELVVEPRQLVASRRGRSGGPLKWIVAGLGGALFLAGVIIYFSDGSKLEIDDGTAAVIETNPDGTLKSVTTKSAKPRSAATVHATKRSSNVDQAESGFVSLFPDGDLSGWSGMAGRWSIVNDELIGSGSSDQTSLESNTTLCSNRTYQDFELRVDVKIGGNAKHPANSGIQFRSTLNDSTTYKVAGPQADIGEGFWGSVYGERTSGMMRAADKDLVDKVVRADDWNAYQLTVRGDSVAISINGMEVLNDDFLGLPESGLIGFQIHRGRDMTVRFRNARVKEFSRNTTSTDRVPGVVEQSDWIDLFNGRDLAGWRQIHRTDVWSVNAGYIFSRSRRGKEKAGGWIETERHFTDFELELDYYLGRDGNSGVFLRTAPIAAAPKTMVTGANQLEVQLLDDKGPKLKGKVSGVQLTGAIYGVVEPRPRATAPINQWNHMSIRAVGPNITVSVNGTKIVDSDLDQLRSLINGRFQYTRGGPIALQWHGNLVRFRNIRVRELDQ